MRRWFLSTEERIPRLENSDPIFTISDGKSPAAAREIVLDRIAYGELPPDSADGVFDIAA